MEAALDHHVTLSSHISSPQCDRIHRQQTSRIAFNRELARAAPLSSFLPIPHADASRWRKSAVLASQGLAKDPPPEPKRITFDVANGNGAAIFAQALTGGHGSDIPKMSGQGSGSPKLDPPCEPKSVHDYMTRAVQFLQMRDAGPPRWFCPIECCRPPEDAPILLFLPGMDGTGLGLIRHYESLRRMFEVRCLHIPAFDRTPAEELMIFVENTLEAERCNKPSRPIYLVGDSLGGSLALAIASRNPNMDLVLVLANPATSFNSSQLQPFLPLMEVLPDDVYRAVPALYSFTMGDPIRMALAKVDPSLPAFKKAQALSDSLHALLPTLPILADILPKETLVWKIKLLRSMAMYTNSRLHAVTAEVLILASGKDQLLASGNEAQKLQRALGNCVIRYFKDSGHTLLLEERIDLGTVIRGAKVYRKGKKYDAVSDFVTPTWNEFEDVWDRNRLYRQLSSPVFFSKMEDGSVVQGLSGVPEDGPLLLVGYHMLMGLELASLACEFLKRKQIIRGIAHPLLFSRVLERGLTEVGFNDDMKVFGAVPATKKNFFKIMHRRESALLYPGGAREALHRKGEAYKLFWPEHSEFVRTAARFGYTIVPFGVVGEDDLMEVVLDYNDLKHLPFYKSIFEAANKESFQLRRGEGGEVSNQELHLPLLVPKVPPGRIYFLFGKPFPTTGKQDLRHNREEAKLAYLDIKKEVEECLAYLQSKREQDPYRECFPRILYETMWGENWQAPTFKP